MRTRKELRAARIAQGICVNCRNKALPNRTSCASCRDQQDRYNRLPGHAADVTECGRKRRARLKEQGLCVACGKSAPREGLNTCQECSEYRKAAAERLRKRRLLEEESLIREAFAEAQRNYRAPKKQPGRVDRMMQLLEKKPVDGLTAEDIYRRRPQEWA